MHYCIIYIFITILTNYCDHKIKYIDSRLPLKRPLSHFTCDKWPCSRILMASAAADLAISGPPLDVPAASSSFRKHTNIKRMPLPRWVKHYLLFFFIILLF